MGQIFFLASKCILGENRKQIYKNESNVIKALMFVVT